MLKHLIFLTLTFSSINTFAQVSPNEKVTQRITKNLIDSLGLSEKQSIQINDINKQLQEFKMEQWKIYSNRDSLRMAIQRIENTRDSLYKAVISEESFIKYKKKKASLINNNN